jgi:hypothetical protein
VRVSTWLTEIGTCKGSRECIKERSRDRERTKNGEIREIRREGEKDNEVNKK